MQWNYWMLSGVFPDHVASIFRSFVLFGLAHGIVRSTICNGEIRREWLKDANKFVVHKTFRVVILQQNYKTLPMLLL